MSKWCEKCDNSLEHCACKKVTEGECDHKFVFKRKGVSGQIFRCHECGDTKVVR